MDDLKTLFENLKSDAERDELIADYLPSIKYFAQRVSFAVGSSFNADLGDLVNEGVIGLFDAIEKFDSSRGMKFKKYARIRINAIILSNLKRLDDRNKKESLMDGVPGMAIQKDPFCLFCQSENKKRIARSINMLPEKERLVITLYYFKGLKMKEVAKILGVSGSRASRIHRKAVLLLKTKLEFLNGQN